ncbi:Adenylate cyclase type 7 [Saguinus oedipus]|uniref:Adenylate cyclase type 7 n=1 Tax=Saguinus oedipus TaxID=9490 RepID=A0ABQ9TJZ0_SAGOE|nr:Adenylate cyclase type 7 [Saguinus oedipus]
MPAKGRYFLNEGEEGPDQDALYEKYRLTSQHGPLLLTLLLVAVIACLALIIIAFSHGDPSGHQAILGTAFLVLAVFSALSVLVYVECLLRRWLRALALLVWACLMALGYVLVSDAWTKAACSWEQVTGDSGLPDGCRLSSSHPRAWCAATGPSCPTCLAVCLGWAWAGFVPVSSLH